MLGINMAFWVGMGVVTLIVVVGCGVAWGLPPKKTAAAQTKPVLPAE